MLAIWHGELCSRVVANLRHPCSTSFKDSESIQYMLTNFFQVFFAYTVITTEKTLLFIGRQEQLNDSNAVRQYLGDLNMTNVTKGEIK